MLLFAIQFELKHLNFNLVATGRMRTYYKCKLIHNIDPISFDGKVSCTSKMSSCQSCYVEFACAPDPSKTRPICVTRVHKILTLPHSCILLTLPSALHDISFHSWECRLGSCPWFCIPSEPSAGHPNSPATFSESLQAPLPHSWRVKQNASHPSGYFGLSIFGLLTFILKVLP